MAKMLDPTSLYCTVRNMTGQGRFFGFIPPHGKYLAAAEEFSIFGDLNLAVGGGERAEGRRRLKQLARALESGDLLLVRTPAPILQDTVTSVIRIPQLASGTLSWVEPSWEDSVSAEPGFV